MSTNCTICNKEYKNQPTPNINILTKQNKKSYFVSKCLDYFGQNCGVQICHQTPLVCPLLSTLTPSMGVIIGQFCAEVLTAVPDSRKAHAEVTDAPSEGTQYGMGGAGVPFIGTAL